MKEQPKKQQIIQNSVPGRSYIIWLTLWSILDRVQRDFYVHRQTQQSSFDSQNIVQERNVRRISEKQ